MSQHILYAILWGTKLLYYTKIYFSSYFGWNKLMLFLSYEKFKFSVCKYFMLTTCTFLSFLKNSCDNRTWPTLSVRFRNAHFTPWYILSFFMMLYVWCSSITEYNLYEYITLFISEFIVHQSLPLEQVLYKEVTREKSEVISVQSGNGKKLSLEKFFRKWIWHQCSIRAGKDLVLTKHPLHMSDVCTNPVPQKLT